MDNIEPHYKVAMDFFFLWQCLAWGFIHSIFFSSAVANIPKRLPIPGLIAAASFASFLYLPSSTLQPVPAADRLLFILITFFGVDDFHHGFDLGLDSRILFFQKNTINQK